MSEAIQSLSVSIKEQAIFGDALPERQATTSHMFCEPPQKQMYAALMCGAVRAQGSIEPAPRRSLRRSITNCDGEAPTIVRKRSLVSAEVRAASHPDE
jgi:hypothetical protein